MLDYKVKIGLVAMRRNATDRPRGTFLTWYSAEQRGKRFVDYIEQNFSNDKVSFVDNKGIGIADLVFDDKSASEVIERFRAEAVDAVMIINCNFGNEEAAADIAQALGKPVGSDGEQNKTTFLSFYSVEQAREYATQLTEAAISEISGIEDSQRLTDFACYLLDRQK